jgi:hypothetical protein
MRAWQTVIECIRDGLHDMQTLSAVVGKPVAAEYLSFCQLADKITTPQEVWLSPETARVPEESESSALHLIVTTLTRACEAQHVNTLVTYMRRLPRLYAALLSRDILRRHGAKLVGSRQWQTWFNENQSLFVAES